MKSGEFPIDLVNEPPAGMESCFLWGPRFCSEIQYYMDFMLEMKRNPYRREYLDYMPEVMAHLASMAHLRQGCVELAKATAGTPDREEIIREFLDMVNEEGENFEWADRSQRFW